MKLHELNNAFTDVQLNELFGFGNNQEKQFEKLRNNYFKRIYPAWREYLSNAIASGTDVDDLNTFQQTFNTWVDTKGFGGRISSGELPQFKNTSEDAQKQVIMQAVAKALNAVQQQQQDQDQQQDSNVVSLKGADGNDYQYAHDGQNWIEQSTKKPVIDQNVANQLDQLAQQKQQGGQQQQQVQAQDTQQQAQQRPNQTDQSSKLFTDPNAFQQFWDNYVASKGGENYQLIADPKMLQTLKDIWMNGGGTVLKETFYKSGYMLLETVTYDMTPHQRYVTENIYRSMSYLIEASLSPEQIDGLFKKVHSNVAATGKNRTGLGQAKDKVTNTTKQVQQALSKAGQYIQDTRPVKAFDEKYDKLKNKIVQNLGNDSKIVKYVTKMGELAKENPGKTAAIIGTLTLVSSLAAGPAGGAIAGQVLRGSLELIKGEKLSTAIGKGLMTAGVGYLAGMSVNAIGETLGNAASDLAVEQFNKEYGSIHLTFNGNFNGIRDFVDLWFAGKQGQVDTLAKLFDQAVTAWDNQDFEKSAQLFNKLENLVDAIDTPENIAKRLEATQNVRNIQANAEKLKEFFGYFGAAAQGAASGAVSFDSKGQPQKSDDKTTLSESKTVMLFRLLNNIPLREGFGENLTNKITSDKLRKIWKKAGSPTDSNVIYKILLKAGIDKEHIDSAFDALGIDPYNGQQGQQQQAQQGNAQNNQNAQQGQTNVNVSGDTTAGQQDQNQQQQNQQGQQSVSGNTTTGGGNDYKELRAAWETHTENGGGLNPKVRAVLRDILNTVYTTVK